MFSLIKKLTTTASLVALCSGQFAFGSDNKIQDEEPRLLALDIRPAQDLQAYASRTMPRKQELIQNHVLPLLAAFGIPTGENYLGPHVVHDFEEFEDPSLIPVICDALTSYYASYDKPNYAFMMWSIPGAFGKLKTREMIEAVCAAFKMNDEGGPLTKESRLTLFSTEMYLYEIVGIIEAFGKLQDSQKVRWVGEAMKTFRTFLFTPARGRERDTQFMIDPGHREEGLHSLTSNALFADVHAFLQSNTDMFFPSEMPGIQRSSFIAAFCNLKDKRYLEAIKGVIHSLDLFKSARDATWGPDLIKKLGAIEDISTLTAKCEAIKPYKQALMDYLQPRMPEIFFEHVACKLLKLENEATIKDVCEGVIKNVGTLLGLCRNPSWGFLDMDSNDKSKIINGLIKLKNSATIKEVCEAIASLGDFTPISIPVNAATTIGDFKQALLAHEVACSFVKKYREDRRTSIIEALLELKSAEQIRAVYQTLKTHASEYLDDPEQYELMIALISLKEESLIATVCEGIRTLSLSPDGRHGWFFGREKLIMEISSGISLSGRGLEAYPDGVRATFLSITAYGNSLLPADLPSSDGYNFVRPLIQMNDEGAIYRACEAIVDYTKSGDPATNGIISWPQLLALKDLPVMSRMRDAVRPVADLLKASQLDKETLRKVMVIPVELNGHLESIRVALRSFFSTLSTVGVSAPKLIQSLEDALIKAKKIAKSCVRTLKDFEENPEYGKEASKRDCQDIFFLMDHAMSGSTQAAVEAFTRASVNPALSQDDRIQLTDSLGKLVASASALRAAFEPKARYLYSDYANRKDAVQSDFKAYTAAAILLEHQLQWPSK